MKCRKMILKNFDHDFIQCFLFCPQFLEIHHNHRKMQFIVYKQKESTTQKCWQFNRFPRWQISDSIPTNVRNVRKCCKQRSAGSQLCFLLISSRPLDRSVIRKINRKSLNSRIILKTQQRNIFLSQRIQFLEKSVNNSPNKHSFWYPLDPWRWSYLLPTEETPTTVASRMPPPWSRTGMMLFHPFSPKFSLVFLH